MLELSCQGVPLAERLRLPGRSDPLPGATSARPSGSPSAAECGRILRGGQGPRTAWRPGVRTWRVDSRRLSARWTGPGSSADRRLWRGPGPRTTVAGAVGRMAMRWGRMKAIVQDRYGSADVLDFRDVARPEVGPADVLVKVVAAGVDLVAWHFMTGQPYLMRILGFGLRAPRTRVPGTNVAGRVEAVGRDVAGFEPGEQVY